MIKGALFSYRMHLFCRVALALSIGGCSTTGPINTEAVRADMPRRQQAINDLGQPSIITLEIEPSAFWTRDYDHGSPIPNVMVGPIEANDVSVGQLLQITANRINVGFVKDPEVDERRITLLDPNKRTLKEFLDIVARQSGLFYEYRNGMLSFQANRRFIVRVPRIEGSLATISEAFKNLGASEVYVDEVTGSITMTVDYKTYRMAQQFLRTFEQGRDMLIYDIWVFERVLRRDEAAGIWWDKLQAKVGSYSLGVPSLSQSGSSGSGSGTSIGPAAAAGMQFGVIQGANSAISNLLIQAMSEDSNTETVARPTMTMMSGGSSEFRIGEKQQYISQVNNTTSSGLNAATTQGVTPDTLETGIVLRLAGAYSDEIINTKIDLAIENLVAFQVFSTSNGSTQTATTNTGTSVATGGTTGTSTSTGVIESAMNALTGTNTGTTVSSAGATTLRLPYTTNRTLRTIVDARPGDLIILGGLISTSSQVNDRRLYRTTLPLQNANNQERRETIMFMRPRLVRIRPKGQVAISADEIRVAPGVGRNVRTESGPLIMQRDPRALERAARNLSVPPKNGEIFDADGTTSFLPRSAPRARSVSPSSDPLPGVYDGQARAPVPLMVVPATPSSMDSSRVPPPTPISPPARVPPTPAVGSTPAVPSTSLIAPSTPVVGPTPVAPLPSNKSGG